MDKNCNRNTDSHFVIDDTSIYEVDIDCYQCLSQREKNLYFSKDELEYMEDKNKDR